MNGVQGPDLVTLTTVWHGMQRICHEMRHVIDRTAQSYLLAQAHDVSVGIWDAQGRTLAIPVGVAGQFVGGKFAVRSLLERFEGNINPGDVFLTNDPYRGGHAPHLPDWGFLRPIFQGDELLFFTLARGHQMDNGGAYPGGYFAAPFDLHAEGLCIPPIKVFDRGVERTDVLELIWSNTRWPEGVRVDNYSMIAATKVCENRLGELLDRYGRDTVLDCVDAMIKRTSAAVAAEVAAIPDGTYYGESATDDDSVELEQPVWARCEITKQDNRLTIDFTKSDPQQRGFVNTPYASTYSHAMVGVFLFLDTALADYHNEGSMDAIDLVVPPGCVLNPEYPAPVGGSPVNMGTQVMEAVLMAMSKAVPERAIAAWGRHRGDYAFGTDPRTGTRYVRTTLDYDGTAGAVYGFDGSASATSLVCLSTVHRGNVEEEEVRIPWRILEYHYATDLEGAGRWRGGPGVHWAAMNEGSDAGMATGSSDGEITTPAGALGGHPSPYSSTWIRRGDELIEARCHRMHQVHTGDVVVKHSSGGGGVGEPFMRDPKLVLEDVIDEFVSIESAERNYGVAIDSDSMTIDTERTKTLRSPTSAAPTAAV